MKKIKKFEKTKMIFFEVLNKNIRYFDKKSSIKNKFF